MDSGTITILGGGSLGRRGSGGRSDPDLLYPDPTSCTVEVSGLVSGLLPHVAHDNRELFREEQHFEWGRRAELSVSVSVRVSVIRMSCKEHLMFSSLGHFLVSLGLLLFRFRTFKLLNLRLGKKVKRVLDMFDNSCVSVTDSMSGEPE